MKEFVAFVDENTRTGKETGYILLPLEDNTDNLISYLKTKYKLSDKKFEEVLRDNEVDGIDPIGGELSIKQYGVTWTKKQAENESESGRYVEVFSVINDIPEWHLFPIEQMPQVLLSYITQKANITEEKLVKYLNRYYKYSVREGLPKSGDINLDEGWVSWSDATEWRVIEQKNNV